MTKKSVKPVVIVQDEIDPIPTKILAQSIVRIDSAVTNLLSSGLTRDALVTLLFRIVPAPTSRTDIDRVLSALSSLRRTFTTLPASK